MDPCHGTSGGERWRRGGGTLPLLPGSFQNSGSSLHTLCRNEEVPHPREAADTSGAYKYYLPALGDNPEQASGWEKDPRALGMGPSTGSISSPS